MVGIFVGFGFLPSRRGDGDLKSHVTGCNGTSREPDDGKWDVT